MITRRTLERLDDEAGDHPAGGGVDALADDAAPQADGDEAAAAPRIVFCEVTGRRDLAQRAAAAFPGSRFVWRRSWLEDPGERRARARRRSTRRVPVGMWLWSGAEEELLARANDVLLRFVHPLVARGLPYCIGFPFAADVFEVQPGGVGGAEGAAREHVGGEREPDAVGETASHERVDEAQQHVVGPGEQFLFGAAPQPHAHGHAAPKRNCSPGPT